jgi:hypothetical protein
LENAGRQFHLSRGACFGRLPLIVPIVVLCAALSSRATAEAAVVTVGSPLSGAESPKECAGVGGCAVLNGLLSDPDLSVVSPVTGAIVLWRVGEASALPGYQLLTLRQLTAEEFLVTGSSPAVTPAGSGGIETFPATLPIEGGEYLGVDVPQGGKIGASAPGAYFFRTPGLAGGTAGLFEETTGDEIAFNADVLPPPTITSLGTTSGSSTGGTTVAIAGANFSDVKGVSFGSTAATYRVDSESQISATSPAGAAGSVPVTVTTIAGSGTSPQQFTYAAEGPTSTSTPITTAAPTCKAPKLNGKKLKVAKRALKKADCRLGHVAKKKGVTARSGKVIAQKPKAGAVDKAGSKVAVRLG